MSTTRTPWHVRTARKYGQSTVLYAALALSAPGEYSLARMAGWSDRVAWLMPAVMSLYAAISASVSDAQKKAMKAAAGTRGEDEARRRYRNASFGALVALAMATAAQVAEHILTTHATGNRGWVVVVVSAVPPLVAAHVLHIDPPADAVATDNAVDVDDEPREAPAQEPQKPVSPPPADEPEEEPAASDNGAQGPVWMTYAEVASALGCATETVRGWAAQQKITKRQGDRPNTVLVDLVECKAVQSRRLMSV